MLCQEHRNGIAHTPKPKRSSILRFSSIQLFFLQFVFVISLCKAPEVRNTASIEWWSTHVLTQGQRNVNCSRSRRIRVAGSPVHRFLAGNPTTFFSPSRLRFVIFLRFGRDTRTVRNILRKIRLKIANGKARGEKSVVGFPVVGLVARTAWVTTYFPFTAWSTAWCTAWQTAWPNSPRFPLKKEHVLPVISFFNQDVKKK